MQLSNNKQNVAETSSIFNNKCLLNIEPDIILNYTNDISNNELIDLTFIKFNENIYSILNKKCILEDLKLQKYIRIPNFGIVCEIILINFPSNQYILSANGEHIATTNYNVFTQNCTFDIAKSNNDMINILKNITTIKNELYINHRNKYLNLEKINNLFIINPMENNLNKQMLIQMKGYFKEGQNWTHDLLSMDIFPYDTYHLSIDKITESIDIIADVVGTIIFIIDITQYIIPVGPTITKITFENNNYSYIGAQNIYLSSVIKQTINFSRVNNVSIISLNCKITQLYQNYYETFSYPERNKIFL